MISTDRLSSRRRRAVAELLDRTRTHDGVSALDEAAVLALDGTTARHLLIEERDGEAVDDTTVGERSTDGTLRAIGYTSVLADGTVQGMVDPAERRRGHGQALLDRALADHPHARIWSHGALPASMAFLEARDLQPVRTLLTMRRPLGVQQPVPDPPPIRADERGTGAHLDVFDPQHDAEAWVRVNAAAFQDHPEQGSLGLADLRRRMEQEWFRAEDLLVARPDDGGDLLGFVWVKRVPGQEAEIYAVGTAPQAQRRGVAAHLLGAALRQLEQAGEPAVTLYVEGSAGGAVALYESWGFEVSGRHVQLRPGGAA